MRLSKLDLMQHGAMCAARMGGVCDCRVADDVVSKLPEARTATQVLQERDQHVSWLRDELVQDIADALHQVANNGPARDYRADAVRIVITLDNYMRARAA